MDTYLQGQHKKSLVITVDARCPLGPGQVIAIAWAGKRATATVVSAGPEPWYGPTVHQMLGRADSTLVRDLILMLPEMQQRKLADDLREYPDLTITHTFLLDYIPDRYDSRPEEILFNSPPGEG